ncbi:polysaccharide pyruvyl transferase family protein [Aromatoleum buckelii]|uniref:Polysaccharide pyruvyl transferase n=1 Tax=Aromatoleum buckelii TaxID=200254 RepID=A0ABX1N458_9RHOO|nr:polysaccharide pyruvyl transferase family protein [Aromatoleum buckelii]MCK0510268.1 polysaccharide pyruvyl transferase family protein [Aromatoleum buckelii]
MEDRESGARSARPKPAPEPPAGAAADAGRVFRVGISGSYGGLNLGDEAILGAMVSELRASLPVEITVFSRNVEDTRRRHKVDHVHPVRQLTRNEARAVVEGLDVFVLGGGGILYDDETEIYLREVMLAHEAGVPVMVYAISAGPLVRTANRDLVREALNRAAVITVRDRQGRRLLEEIGVDREVRVTADPALLLEPEPLPKDALRREGIDHGRRLIGASVREPGPAAPDIDIDHCHSLFANAADFIADRLDADIVFVPLERQHVDMQHSYAVLSRMQLVQRGTLLKGEYTPGQLLTLMGHFELAIGMRLHFLIFAAIQGVPFVALPYASKVTGLLQDLELEMPPMNDVNTGRLLANVDRSWDQRDVLRRHLQQRLPALQERARENNRLLVALLHAGASMRSLKGG